MLPPEAWRRSVERKWKIYKREDSEPLHGRMLEWQTSGLAPHMTAIREHGHIKIGPKPDYRDVTERVILESYGPTGVLIDEKGQILYVHGRTGNYLEVTPGEFSGSIVGMTREGLKLELAQSIRRAATRKTVIRSERLSVKTNGGALFINLVVKPILEPASMRGQLLVLFEDVPFEEANGAAAEPIGSIDAGEHPEVRRLEHELLATREYLQSTIEALETSNEELQSTNEELQSANEELQSTNEELETSKEELQSVNEELNTVNAELQKKIEELTRTSNDMNNLLASTDIGAIFLDTHLNVQRFTPTMTNFINLIQADVGRPLGHIVTHLKYGRLVDDAQEVLRTLVPKEEVQTNDNRWYAMRILRYRTLENVIDEVGIAFGDTSVFRRGMRLLGRSLKGFSLGRPASRISEWNMNSRPSVNGQFVERSAIEDGARKTREDTAGHRRRCRSAVTLNVPRCGPIGFDGPCEGIWANPVAHGPGFSQAYKDALI